MARRLESLAISAGPGWSDAEATLDYYLTAAKPEAKGKLTSRAAYASLSEKYCKKDPLELLLSE